MVLKNVIFYTYQSSCWNLSLQFESGVQTNFYCSKTQVYLLLRKKEKWFYL